MHVQDPTSPYFGFEFAAFDGDASFILYEVQIDEAMSCGSIILHPMVLVAAAVGTCNPSGAFCGDRSHYPLQLARVLTIFEIIEFGCGVTVCVEHVGVVEPFIGAMALFE